MSEENIVVTVDAVSTKNLGIKSEDENIGQKGWLNYGGKDVQGTQRDLASIRKGDEVELLVVDGKFTAIVNHVPGSGPKETTQSTVHQAASPQAKKTAADFLEDYVTFEELLEKLKEATGDKFSIETKMLMHDPVKQACIFQASVRGEFGEVTRHKLVGEKVIEVKEPNAKWATAHGDCDQQNGGMVKVHYIRMAETRAVARALRMVLGIGKTAAEEVERK